MKNLLITCVCLAIIIPVFAQDEIIASKAEKEVIIDGIASEWNQNFHTNKEGKLSFAISNDNEFVFLCVQTLDRSTQQKITRSGMIVNLSSKGKNKFKANISYPLKANLVAGNNSQREPGQGGNRQQMRKEALNNCVDMKVKGLLNQTGLLPNKNDTGLSVAINWEAEQLLTYELCIPLAELLGENYNIEDLAAIPISIKITANALPQPQSSSRGAGGGGGRGGGGRGGGGRPPSGGQSGQNDMSTTTTLKNNFFLNTGK
jgi:hypothetical protein